MDLSFWRCILAQAENVISIEQDFNVGPDRLWEAITSRDEMVQWFFGNIPEFEARVGFETSFPVESTTRCFVHIWRVETVVPMKEIAYTWCYEHIDGEGRVVFRISPLPGNRSRLVLEKHGLHTFPKEIPEFSEENCRAGWNYFIKEQLANYLSKS